MLQMENDFNLQAADAQVVPRRQRWFKERMSELFFEKMSEFLRTFLFTKEGVRHLTSLLGKF